MIKKKARVRIELISYQNTHIKTFIEKVLINFDTPRIRIVPIPKRRKIFSVLKSPFVNKKAIEQFSLKVYKRLIIIECEDIKEMKYFLGGVSLKNVAIKIKEYSLIW